MIPLGGLSLPSPYVEVLLQTPLHRRSLAKHETSCSRPWCQYYQILQQALDAQPCLRTHYQSGRGKEGKEGKEGKGGTGEVQHRILVVYARRIM